MHFQPHDRIDVGHDRDGGARIQNNPCRDRGASSRTSLISQIALPELAPCGLHRRLPGFTGPNPSTRLDKAALFSCGPRIYGIEAAVSRGSVKARRGAAGKGQSRERPTGTDIRWALLMQFLDDNLILNPALARPAVPLGRGELRERRVLLGIRARPQGIRESRFKEQ